MSEGANQPDVRGQQTIVREIKPGLMVELDHGRELSGDGQAQTDGEGTRGVAIRIVTRFVHGPIHGKGDVLEFLGHEQWKDERLAGFREAFLDGTRRRDELNLRVERH